MAVKHRVAIVGFGFMGRMHYGCWKKIRGVKVVAVCDKNLSQLKTAQKGNIAGADSSALPSSIAPFTDFDTLLARADADIVDITLPTPFHRALSVKALAAGKNVLCEKPMALTVRDCDAMLAAAARSSGRLMIAQCLRFWPEYCVLKKLVAEGRYGAVISADFSRLAVAPDRESGRSWYLDERRSGGVALDLHLHDADMIMWLFGPPASVTSGAHRRVEGTLDHISTHYAYSDKAVSASGSWAASSSFGFEASFKVVFEKAVVVLDPRASESFLIYPENGKPFAPRLSKTSAYAAEIASFVASLDKTHKGTSLTPLDARNAVALITAERKSAQTGRTVRFVPAVFRDGK